MFRYFAVIITPQFSSRQFGWYCTVSFYKPTYEVVRTCQYVQSLVTICIYCSNELPNQLGTKYYTVVKDISSKRDPEGRMVQCRGQWMYDFLLYLDSYVNQEGSTYSPHQISSLKKNIRLLTTRRKSMIYSRWR